MNDQKVIVLISADSNLRQKVSNYFVNSRFRLVYLRRMEDLTSWSVLTSSAMIICDYHLRDWHGFSLLCALQDRGVSVPMVMVVDDLNIRNQCPLYYRVLSGLIAKKNFESMMLPIRSSLFNYSFIEEPL